MGWIRFSGMTADSVCDSPPPSVPPHKGKGDASTTASVLPSPSPLWGGIKGGGRAWRRAIGIALTLLATPAFAQALPYHSDPNAREILPSLTPVPAIRFLTT